MHAKFRTKLFTGLGVAAAALAVLAGAWLLFSTRDTPTGPPPAGAKILRDLAYLSPWRADPIRIRRFEDTTPEGPIRGLFARIDLANPQVELVVTAPLADADPPGPDPRFEARLVPLDSWMKETGCTFGVNGNYFGRLPDDDTLINKARGWQNGQRVTVIGLSISDARVVSPARIWEDQRPDPSLLIGSDRVARLGYFSDEDAAKARVRFALAGIGPAADEPKLWSLLVEDGQNRGETSRTQPTKRHPRTAIGATKDGRTLIIAVIDGRQPEHSIGATLPELAGWMIAEGAANAVNLDGGGSTSMILNLPRSGQITNQPSEGRFRPVANHFGVRLRPFPDSPGSPVPPKPASPRNPTK